MRNRLGPWAATTLSIGNPGIGVAANSVNWIDSEGEIQEGVDTENAFPDDWTLYQIGVGPISSGPQDFDVRYPTGFLEERLRLARKNSGTAPNLAQQLSLASLEGKVVTCASDVVDYGAGSIGYGLTNSDHSQIAGDGVAIQHSVSSNTYFHWPVELLDTTTPYFYFRPVSATNQALIVNQIGLWLNDEALYAQDTANNAVTWASFSTSATGTLPGDWSFSGGGGPTAQRTGTTVVHDRNGAAGPDADMTISITCSVGDRVLAIVSVEDGDIDTAATRTVAASLTDGTTTDSFNVTSNTPGFFQRLEIASSAATSVTFNIRPSQSTVQRSRYDHVSLVIYPEAQEIL